MSKPELTPEIRLIQNNGRGDKPNVWIAKRVRNSVHVQWGVLGGKLQATTTEYEALNEGKSNERSPSQVAQDALDRLIKLKTREGYAETPQTDVERFYAERQVTIDFDDLPPNFCFYKPNKKLSAKMEKLMEAGKCVYTRKRDGEMYAVVVNSKSEIDMYSRRMHKSHDKEPTPWARRFDRVVEAVEALNLPPGTILLVEMIMDRNGDDDFRHVTTVTRSLTSRAIEQQKKHGYLSAYVWDVGFFAKTPTASVDPVAKRLEWIASRIPLHNKYLMPVEWYRFSSKDKALTYAKERGWEGFVVVDPTAVYADRAWSFKGKPDRPGTCCKLKPYLEGDFIVDFNPEEGVGHYGKGKRAKGVGAVAVYAKLPNGEMRYMGDCGTGLDDDQVMRLADKSLYPMVWQLEYPELTPKGMLRQPVFVRERPDKDLDDVFVYDPTGDDDEEEAA